MASNNARNRPPVPVFVATTVVIFVLSISAAESVGFVPCYVDGTECTAAEIVSTVSVGPFDASREVLALSQLPQLGSQTSTPEPDEFAVLPERMVIPEINMDLPVQNSESRDIDVLYEELKSGPIRYVDSAQLGEEGNVLIFGHSSRLPVVKNQMYKAFNRVSELKRGDTIRISGGGREYLYSVVSVEQMDIEDPTSVISLAREGKHLTLVTCDTLTGKTARFVLTADFVAVI
ncbi:sortase [Candidatus Kaiserbacteria bacterium]|nr:sortase [Candidatus Kaiserbacteria bacterium]